MSQLDDEVKEYPQWTPDPTDDDLDPLSDQVGDRETEGVIRDPEAATEPETIHVSNTPPQPVNVELDRSVSDPNAAPQVSRVELRSHLERQPASTDRFGEAEQGRAGYVDDGDDR